jgi:hypothetical protein
MNASKKPMTGRAITIDADALKVNIQGVVAEIIRKLAEDQARQMEQAVFITAAKSKAARPTPVQKQSASASQTLTHDEACALYTICSRIAREQNLHEGLVQVFAGACYGVKNFGHLPSERFGEVVKYLIDLRLDKMLAA